MDDNASDHPVWCIKENGKLKGVIRVSDWSPLTNPAQALMVLNGIVKKTGYGAKIIVNVGETEVKIGVNYGLIKGDLEEAFPRAICLAAYRALGGD